MRRGFAAAVGVLAGAAAFGGVTLVALEARGVAVLHTRQADGVEHRTRVWFAEQDGALWVEAATASRPFYVDLAADPALTIEIRTSPFDSSPTRLRARAEFVPEPGGHERIRALLSEKYGWADAWIALLQDTSASRAVRMVVEDDDARGNADARGVMRAGRKRF